ncbi:SPOR domain-containing protein [Ruegeria meonggei]|uniref:Sporulation related domain protein n=1 Tax=Ruegeria meonggei TaxID=1446476 RepID=A0A1X6YDN8_9RHOB|nr:SPOR domain-containing protein [Ruegeria meonggei]SLN17917.1 Sporulation related domain protein [Ruegeria meonggei]
MKRASETRAKPRSLAVLALSLAVLAGCEEALSPDGASGDAQSSDTENDGKTELFPEYSDNSRESVEAPEVFQVTEAGLWDGRPSLGGIWVAHPEVTQPERVVIKNTSNNKTVTGALFRRERNLPGPALQLSSAAAEKLGILAGAPTKVEVVALRRKQAEQKKPAPEETAGTETASAEDTPKVDPAASNGETAETEKPAKRKWWQKKETAAVTGAAVAADAATDTAAEAAEEVAETAVQAAPAATLSNPEVTPPTEKPAKRKWWQKKETAAATGAAVAADAATDSAAEATEEVAETAVQAAPAATLSDPEVTPPTEKPAKRKWWQKKPANEITETTLDPIEGAAAAIDAAEPTAVEAATATQAAAPRSISKPYVQVGTFNVEANAKSAAEKIKRNGLNADVRELESDGKTVWRVLVGPAATRSERNAIQGDVKDLGFTDAFTVKN